MKTKDIYQDQSMYILALKSNKIEEELGVCLDDILNKLTQEIGKFNDVVQKFRGVYSESRVDLKVVKLKLGDVLLHLASICLRLGIDPDDFVIFAGNTLKRFDERKNDYIHFKEN